MLFHNFIIFGIQFGLISGSGIRNDVVKNVKELLFNGNETESNSICLSNACLQNAEIIRKSMNTFVNPCDDFYEFACGKWVENYPIPKGQGAWSRRMDLHFYIRRLRQKILQETEPADVDVQKARMWYKSCMNLVKFLHNSKAKDALEKRNLEPLISILNQIGGWPLAMNTEEWNEKEYNWQKVDDFYSRLIGENGFFSFEVIGDLQTHNYILFINYQKLPLFSKKDYDRRKLYSNNKYKNFILEVALAISKETGSNVSPQQLKNEIQEYLDFEKLLHGAMTSGLKYTKRHTIEDLLNFLKTVRSRNPTSKINILGAINNLFENVNLKINKTEEVIVQVMGYLPILIYILDQTPPRTIVNFIHWSFISKFIDKTSEKYLKMKFDVTDSFHGKGYRSQICEETVKMTDTIANEFVKKYFQPPIKNEAVKLVQSIQNNLEKMVYESTWMDEVAKNESLEKVKNIKKIIGNPDWYDNKTALLNIYNKLSIDTRYFENELNYMNFNYKNKLKNLGQEFDLDRWLVMEDGHSPLFVNAYYLFITNTMSIPVANFLSPFFNSSQPNYLNYGYSGFYIAHEMAHAFDDKGRKFTHEGSWSTWLESTEKIYENKSSCFIRQTIELTKNDEKSKFQKQHGIGLVTKGESMADTTGLQLLYRAYKENTKNKKQLKLSGLENFSNDQLFFLTFANFWCENITPEVNAFRSETDNHNKPKYRVIGSVSNLKEFAEAFQCPIGSPMNPEKKCLIFE